MKKQFITILFYLSFFVLSVGATDTWTISTSSKENYNGITLGNGRIGLVSSSQLFTVTDIVMNGVYDKENREGVSRIVRGPLFTNLLLSIDGTQITDKNISSWTQTLDMRRANLQTQVQTDKAEISYTLRALRNFPYMGMIVVEMLPKTDCMLEVTNSTVFPGELQETSATYKMLKDGKIELPVYTSQAKSLTGM